MKKEVPTASKSTDNNVGEKDMKKPTETQVHANQIMLDDYLSMNKSNFVDEEFGIENNLLEWFPDRKKKFVINYDGDVFVKKSAIQEFVDRGLIYKVGDPCNGRLTTRRPKMLTDAPLLGYTVDFNQYNKLIDAGEIDYQANGALSLCHYDDECNVAEDELDAMMGEKAPATMQRFVRELKLTNPQSIEKLEDLGILVPIEQSNHLADYHETHKSSQQQNNEK